MQCCFLLLLALQEVSSFLLINDYPVKDIQIFLKYPFINELKISDIETFEKIVSIEKEKNELMDLMRKGAKLEREVKQVVTRKEIEESKKGNSFKPAQRA